MSTCDEHTDDFGVDDRLDGGELDESIWIAYFLPQPAGRDASRARYRMTGAHLELFIGTEHDRWMPDLEGDLRVPSQSLNPMTSSTGAASAITARRESAVRCLGRTVVHWSRR